MGLTLKTKAEFQEAEAAWMNGKPYKGFKDYELEHALANFTGGKDAISDNAHGQAFERTSFDGKTSSSATIKKMELKIRR